MVRVAVVGAGIIGLSSAVKVKEKYPHFDVVVISKEFTPHTTGDGSGGLWYPYMCGKNADDMNTWGVETYRFLHELWLKGETSICMIPYFSLTRREDRVPRKWKSRVFGYSELTEKQLDYFNDLHSSKYKAGHTFTSFTVPTKILLPQLEKRLLSAGGSLVQGEVTSLTDAILRPYDVIVNCSGLGAKLIVPDDKVYPIKGQVLRVQAPWLGAAINQDDHYILPNSGYCVLGGTGQVNDFNRTPSETDSKFIMDGCSSMIPGLQHAPLLSSWVGLRPGRENPRIEPEYIDGKLFIHNYGHGGSGFTLFWGCATQVLNILDKELNNNNPFSSKL